MYQPTRQNISVERNFHGNCCENPKFHHLFVNYEEARTEGQYVTKYDLPSVHILDHYWVRNQTRRAVCAYTVSLLGT